MTSPISRTNNRLAPFKMGFLFLLLSTLFVSPLYAAGEEGEIKRTAQAAGTVWAMWPLSLLAVYSLVIAAASILGGSLAARVKMTHYQLQMTMSFVGGLMLGIGVFHMLPHSLATYKEGNVDAVMIWMMVGILVMFLMLRAFHFHQHGSADFSDATQAAQCKHDHHHAEPDELGGGHVHAVHDPHAHKMSGPGVFLGMAVHTIIDGIALAASLQAEAVFGHGQHFFALGTFLAIALHKPLDAVTITSLMAAGKWSRKTITAVNVLFASMCPLGALLFLFGVNSFFVDPTPVVGAALAFAAGVFLCIALSDLLPEMEFHSHNRISLSIALFLGILLAWSIHFLEPSHQHNAPPVPAKTAIE